MLGLNRKTLGSSSASKCVGWILLAFFFTLLTPTPGHAALEVASLANAPTIDGEIGESEWSGAGIVDQNFVQIEPAYGQPSPFGPSSASARLKRLCMLRLRRLILICRGLQLRLRNATAN